MELRITGTDLPGRVCGDDTNVHVGIQVRRDPEQVVAADVATVTFTTEIELVDRDGAVDFKGPAVQGRPGARFIYLTWGSPGAGGDFNMFRRAKLMLDAVDSDVIEAASASGTLRARLGLTDEGGFARCAAVRPPHISWTA